MLPYTFIPLQTRQLAAILFADIAGYTALMQEDEARARKLRDRHQQVMEDRVTAHGGEIIHYYGDGALCLFDSAKEAVLSAHEIQHRLLEEPSVPNRIGIHCGDIIRDELNIYGDGVNVASRIESLAIPGSVLFSGSVCKEIENHPSIRVRSLGEFKLKNVKRPVEIFALDHADIRVPEASEINSNVAQLATKSIAVIPFTYREDNGEAPFFADGLVEEIISGLSKVDGLSVISSATVKAFLKRGDDTLVLARQVNVAYLLEGSVRMAGNQIRVSAQLISTADGYQVWSETYRGSLEDIFGLQDTLARNIVRAMRVNFDLGEKKDKLLEQQTLNPEAHQLYLKGLHHWNKQNPENVLKASEFFNQALDIDAGYSSAQSAISNCYSFLGSCGTLPSTDAYAKALHFAMKAIEINPKNAEAHLAIANLKFHHYWDWEGTKASLDKAASLGLNTGLLNQTYGLYYAAIGEVDLGVEKMKQALQLDPLSLPVMNMLGTLHIFNEQYDQAIQVFNEITELEPSFRSAIQYRGLALTCKGDMEGALKDAIKYHDMVRDPQKGIIGMIIAHFALGHNTEADELLGHLYTRLHKEASAAVEIDLGLVYAGIGDYDKALEFLDHVFEKRFSVACMGMIWILRYPYFKGLWQTDGFKKLLSKMGLSK